MDKLKDIDGNVFEYVDDSMKKDSDILKATRK